MRDHASDSYIIKCKSLTKFCNLNKNKNNLNSLRPRIAQYFIAVLFHEKNTTYEHLHEQCMTCTDVPRKVRRVLETRRWQTLKKA